MQIKKLKRRINWRKGSAELIGIALTLPVLCVLLLMIVGVIQSGIMRQSLEYTTYLSARAAVTCDSAEAASIQARNTAIMTLEDNTFGIDLEQVRVTVELVAGTSDVGGSGITWEKGALAKCEITAPFKSIATFTEEQMTSTLYMMVERPARTYD